MGDERFNTLRVVLKEPAFVHHMTGMVAEVVPRAQAVARGTEDRVVLGDPEVEPGDPHGRRRRRLEQINCRGGLSAWAGDRSNGGTRH